MNATTLVKSLIGRAKQRQVELKKSHWEKYREIKKAVHAGKDADVDELELEAVLEALDKPPEALPADVEAYGRRLTEAAQLAKRPAVQKLITTATAKIEKLTAERDEHYRKMNEQISPLVAQVREAEQEILHCSGAEAFLRQTCDDPSIIQRESELKESSRKLHEREQALNEERHQTDIWVARFNSEIESKERRCQEDSCSRVSIDSYRKEIAETRERLVPLLERQRKYDADKQAIAAERQQITGAICVMRPFFD